MADDVEDELVRNAPYRLLEWRIRQVEIEQHEMNAKIERLATRDDVQKIETKLDTAAQTKSDRTFMLWAVAIAGPTFSGIIVGLVLFALLQQHPGVAHP